MRRLGAGALVLLPCLLAACAGNWQHVHERLPGKATTEVTVRTVPSGADVSVNGNYLAPSPLTVPLRYPFIMQVYERRRILPWPHVESREVPRYEQSFRFEAVKPGYLPATATVFPQGEERLDVEIRLVPRAPDR